MYHIYMCIRILMHILLGRTLKAITATTNFCVTIYHNGMATAHSGMALLAYALLEIKSLEPTHYSKPLQCEGIADWI